MRWYFIRKWLWRRLIRRNLAAPCHDCPVIWEVAASLDWRRNAQTATYLSTGVCKATCKAYANYRSNRWRFWK